MLRGCLFRPVHIGRLPVLGGFVEKRLDQPIAEIVYGKFDMEDNVQVNLSKVHLCVISIKFRLVSRVEHEVFALWDPWVALMTR